MTASRWSMLVVIGGLAVGATGCREQALDPGLVGTWVRETGSGVRSEVSIWQEDGVYRFRVNRFAADGAPLLRCPREGACTIYQGDAPSYELECRTSQRPGEEGLFVEWRGRPLQGQGRGGTPIQWIDRITVLPGGLELTVSRIELNGQPREEWPRSFSKVDNDPRY